VGALALCWLLLVLAAPAEAQPGPPDEPVRVADVDLTGDLGPFDGEELHALLRTRPNRRFLGIPGVTPGLWTYRLGESGVLPQFLSRAFVRSGEPPAVLEPTDVETDRERLEALYRQEGFRNATVTAAVDSIGADRVRVRFDIAPGPPSTVETVRYEGLAGLDDQSRRRFARETLLRLDVPRTVDTLAFPARGQRLSEPDLLAERRRMITFLRDEGFARVTRDSIRAVAFEVDSLTYDVAFRIQPGARYAFGDVHFEVEGPAEDAVRSDTFAVGEGVVTVQIEDEPALDAGLLVRSIRFRPGESYSQRDLLATKRRLERTGVFSFSEITSLPGAAPDTAASGDALPRIAHRIALRTRQRHRIRLEGFVLQRTGLLTPGGSNLGGDELGFGVGASYRNANAFGGGEAFEVRTSGSVAGEFGAFPTAQGEVSAALGYPYLIPPFGFIERALRPFNTRTQLSLGLLTARRDELRLLIRGRASAGLRLDVQHTPTLSSLLDVVDFRLSDPDTLSGFADAFLDLVEDPVARAFVLDDYTRPQINNAVRYTLRAVTADLFRRDEGYAREFAAEVGGNVPYLLDRYVFTPDTTEGTIPGLPLFGGESRLEYRPYVRFIGDVREYRPLGRLTTIAAKAIVGVAHPTGDAPVVPFDRRFYVGGANSVRGWQLRTLGPGGVRPGEAAFVQGGDVKLELGFEWRRILLRDLFAADWALALFSDAGNVWLGPRNPSDEGRFRVGDFYEEIAVGAGAGLRVAWDFLILRFDLAWQVHSPVPGTDLFPEGNRPLFHFGIGQAF
jgi:outer membrane translocation and assembly module TamA